MKRSRKSYSAVGLLRLDLVPALVLSLAVIPLGLRAEAVAVLDNTPAPQGFNTFSAPASPNDGQTHIL